MGAAVTWRMADTRGNLFKLQAQGLFTEATLHRAPSPVTSGKLAARDNAGPPNVELGLREASLVLSEHWRVKSLPSY